MYEKAFREVNEVLENMDEKYTKMIPPSFINMMIKNIDWSYNFEYDKTKKLEEQLISDDAKTILSIIYLRYFASKEEQQEFMKDYQKNKILEEKIKKEKYDVDNIFKKRKEENIKNIETEVALCKIPEKWYKKIFNKIKSFFNISK